MQALGRHALIIEDEILIALEIEALLEDLGFQSFDIVDRPEDALASARVRRPDLITADYRIVGGTGVEAVDAIWAAVGIAPVVFVTGNADLLSRRPDARVVEKPISASEFALACAEACPRST